MNTASKKAYTDPLMYEKTLVKVLFSYFLNNFYLSILSNDSFVIVFSSDRTSKVVKSINAFFFIGF
jgi:hypothetical protein